MGEVKHLLLAKVQGWSLVRTDRPSHQGLCKSRQPRRIHEIFRWGTDVSIENLHQGFTRVFESAFESTEGIATYISHPTHVEFANGFLAQLDEVLVVDYKPTAVDP